MDDLRVLWMRDRVYTTFDFSNPTLFEEMLSRDDGEAEDLILHFLNHSSDEDNASALFFYRVLVPEEVEEEEPDIPMIFEEDGEEEETESQKAEGPEKATVKFSKLRSNSMTPSLFDMDNETPELETDSRLHSKKTVKHIVNRLELHVSLTSLPEEFLEQNVVFFLRSSKDAIPEASDMKEAMEIMPETMEYGIINSHVLKFLKDTICQVFMPALSFNQHKSESGQGALTAEAQEFSSHDMPELVGIPGESMEYHSVQLIRDEFLMSLQKFTNNIQRTMQQLEGPSVLVEWTLCLQSPVHRESGLKYFLHLHYLDLDNLTYLHLQ